MAPRPVAVLVVAASLAAAAPAAAQHEVRGVRAAAESERAQTPLEVRGVRADNAAAGGVTVTFTSRAAKLYRRIAGLRTFVRCQTAVADAALLSPLDRVHELFAQKRLPLRRGTLRVRHAPGTTYDVCEVTAVRGLKTVRTLVLPLTGNGVAYLAAKRLGDRLIAAMEVASALGPDGHYPTGADVEVPGLVLLAAPTDSPPAGKVGFFSDGARHMTVVGVTADGRRLFIDADGGVLTGNVPGLVLDQR